MVEMLIKQLHAPAFQRLRGAVCLCLVVAPALACRTPQTSRPAAPPPVTSDASPINAYVDEERSTMAAEDQLRSQEALQRHWQADSARAPEKRAPRDSPLRPSPRWP